MPIPQSVYPGTETDQTAACRDRYLAPDDRQRLAPDSREIYGRSGQNDYSGLPEPAGSTARKGRAL